MSKKATSKASISKSGRTSKDKIIAWHAPEYQHTTKTKDWFWVVGSVGVLVTVGSFWVGNWSLGFLVILATIVLIFLAKREPNTVQVKFNTSKSIISIDSNHIYLKNYQAFNISDYSGNLLLRSKQVLAPLTVVPLPEQAPVNKISDILEDELDFVLDENLHEPILEIFLNRLGF